MRLGKSARRAAAKRRWAEQILLTGKSAIVTGCGPGSLGYATAKSLARWGALVTVTTRHNTDAVVRSLQHELAQEGVEARLGGHELDLCSADSVNNFTGWYQKYRGDRLDILINNAGIHLDLMSKWKEPQLSADGYELQWRTNYLGTAQLTHKLLPIMQSTGDRFGDARIVNVVSQLHNRADNESLFDPATSYNSWKFYGRSKLALIHFSNELNRRFAAVHNLHGYSLHPGGTSGVATNVAGKGLANSPVMGFLNKLGSPLGKLFMSSPEEGAQTQIHCATSPDATGGHYYRNCAIAEPSASCSDENAALRLWVHTLAILKGLEANA